MTMVGVETVDGNSLQADSIGLVWESVGWQFTGPKGHWSEWDEFDTQSIVAWIRQPVQLFRRNRNSDRQVFRPIVCNCDDIKIF